MKHHFSVFLFPAILLLLHCTQTLSQTPTAAPAKAPAAASAPPPAATSSAQASPPVMVPVQVSKGPVNVIKILQKAGGFAVFIRLIKSTQEDIQVFSQLNDSRDGVTIFAPTDGAFSAIIKSGVLNSLSDHQKIELVQFHIIPRILTTANFQTVSNPITTLAGSGSRFALNVITTENMVNVTSGLTNTSVSAIVYTDSQLAIYQVDKVLLPLDIFAPKPLAPAPAPPKPKKDDGAESPLVPEDTSSAVSCIPLNSLIIFGAGMVAAVFTL
uniref:FAS1 domain-containing protein n=1 Tax=Populus trichocarpa TaxID=3694 RepID=A0A2K1Y798_POPTR